MEYVYQNARITTADRIQDRFLTCQIQKAPVATQIPMGTIFDLVEILNPWFPTSQVGQSIISTLNKEYFNSESSSDILNFENALKKINGNLTELTGRGETDWLGNLNSVIALLVNNQLHITKVGDADAYLVREGRISKITVDSKKDGDLHPLRTFTDIVSGTLAENDKIVIGNPLLFEHVAPEELAAILSTNSPAGSALEIARQLRRQKIKKVNAVIIELLTTETLAQKPAEIYPNTVYLDQTTESPLNTVRVNAKKYLFPAASSTGQWLKASFNKLSKNISSRLEKRKAAAEKMELAPVTAQEERIEKPYRPTNPNLSMKEKMEPAIMADTKSPKPNIVIHDYAHKATAIEKYPFLLKTKKFINYLFGGIGTWIAKITRKGMLPQNRLKFLITSAIGIIIITTAIFLGFYFFRSNNAKAAAEKALIQAQTQLDQGKQAVITNNQEAAKNNFASAIASSQTIQKYKNLNSQGKDLENQALGQLDKLTATTRYTKLSEIITFPATSGEMLINENDAYIQNPVNNALMRASLLTGKSEEIGRLPEGSGKVTSSTISKDGTMLFSTDANQLFSLKLPDNKIEKMQNADNQWKIGADIATFDDNIFVLDQGKDQIWKYVKTAGGYGIGREYVADAVDFSGASSLVIDGDVYVLRADGTVFKFTKSKKQNFGLNGIPSPNDTMSNALKIYTTADSDKIYVADAGNKRILQFDKKTGTFKQQWALPSDFNNIQDVSFSLAMMKAWILNNNKIYEISI